MNKTHKAVAFVTGASSGIGLITARALANAVDAPQIVADAVIEAARAVEGFPA